MCHTTHTHRTMVMNSSSRLTTKASEEETSFVQVMKDKIQGGGQQTPDPTRIPGVPEYDPEYDSEYGPEDRFPLENNALSNDNIFKLFSFYFKNIIFSGFRSRCMMCFEWQ